MDDERAGLDFRAAMDALCDGVVAVDADDRVVYVNAAAARLIGRSTGELVGMDAGTLAGGDLVLATSTVPSAGGLRVSCVHRAAPADDDHDGAGRASRAHDALVEALLDGPAEGAVDRALEEFVRALGWEVAVLWCAGDDGALRSRHTWHAGRTGMEAFVATARGMRIIGTEALPGRVRHDGAPSRSADAALDRRYVRASEAARADLHGLILAPVRGSHDVLGILELLTTRRGLPDEALVRAVQTASRQLGQALERAAAERALHESEERLRTTLRSVADAVITTDEQGLVRDLNALAEELTGWTNAQARGRPLEEVYATTQQGDAGALHGSEGAHRALEGTGGVESPARAVLRAGRPIARHGGACLRRRDGWMMTVADSVSPIRADNGAVRGVVVVFRDETERHAEDAWRQLLVDVSAVLMSTLDVEQSLRDVARLVTTGVADGCAIHIVEAGVGIPLRGATSGDVGSLESADVLRRMSTTGRSLGEDEHGDSIMAVPLSHGAVVYGAIGLAMHRDRRAFAPVDVPRARELADRCARAIETAAAFHRTELAVRARDDFLAIASHELKTPLTPLLLQVGALERMLDAREGPIETEAVRRRLGAVHAGVDRLLDLVKTMIDVSRLGDRIEPRAEQTDLVQITRTCVARLSEAARRAGCDVRVEAPLTLGGRWDVRWVEQVVTSLLSNAVKYGRGASIDVRVTDAPAIAQIVVVDRGIGIAAEDHDRIFELFERAVPPHHYGGFGLGLWVVRRIVDGLGGRVEVDSAPGRGATFTVTLPKPAPQYASSTAPIAAS